MRSEIFDVQSCLDDFFPLSESRNRLDHSLRSRHERTNYIFAKTQRAPENEREVN